MGLTLIVTKAKLEPAPYFSKLVASIDETPKIEKLQGLASSSVLVIAPPPTKEEYDRRLVWCSRSARSCFSLIAAFLEEARLNTELFSPSKVLIAPTNVYGDKPKKGNYECVGRLVTHCVGLSTIRKFVCVGSKPFQHHFGFGKKASSDEMYLSILYPRELNGKPLFILPDFSVFNVDPNTMPYPAKKAVIASQERIQRLLVKAMPEFTRFLKL